MSAPVATNTQPDDQLTPRARAAVERVAYSPAEAAAALGVTRQTVYALIERGELRRYKVGRATRLNAAEVLALVGGGPDAA